MVGSYNASSCAAKDKSIEKRASPLKGASKKNLPGLTKTHPKLVVWYYRRWSTAGKI